MSHVLRYVLQALCLPFLLSSSSSVAMLARQHKQRFGHLSAPKSQAIKSITTVSEIDCKIEEMKEGIFQEYIQEICHQSKGQLSESELKTGITAIRTIKSELLKYNNSYAIHDPNLPLSMYDNVQTTLKPDINPNSMTIQYASSDNPYLLAVAYGETKPAPKIKIYEALSRRSQEEQLFILRHEASHVLLSHSLFPRNSRRFNSVTEREANIHAAASKNSIIACTGAKLQCLNGHPDIIDNKTHCGEMLTMCALMQLREQFEQNSTLSS